MQTIILIPPSEGKAEGGNSKPLQSVTDITADLIEAIKEADPQKLYGLKQKALEKAIAANNKILTSETMPAIERYTGVVYDAIDYRTLSHKADFDEKVLIVSGLFGLVSPTDLIPNYRLKIDKLKAAKLWVNSNSEQLKDKFIIDLLPQAHKKAVKYDNGIAVEFVLKKAGKKMPAGHQGKHIKGRFVRWLIENDITDAKDFIDFKEEGYHWTGEFFLKEIQFYRHASISDDVVSYDVRHLFCSSMLSQGADPNTVSRLMGHASTKMTLDRYGHVMLGDEGRAVELLPELVIVF